jgi:Ni,Fe-hydrogenase III small subunit/ferredoxin
MLSIILDALTAGRATERTPGQGTPGTRYQLVAPGALQEAIDICPSRAITVDGPDTAVLDEGRCVACGLCAEGPGAAFRAVPGDLGVSRARADLRRRFSLAGAPAPARAPDHAADDAGRLAEEGTRLAETVRRRLARSLHIRHLDAGGCNGCDWELNQLTSPVYDVQRFGCDFVASPRHADLLLVTGVVTANLELALVRTLDAMPRPRLVLAVGACAISGGIFGTSEASRGGADRVVAVDAYVAGCPPRPWAIIQGIRALLAP